MVIDTATTLVMVAVCLAVAITPAALAQTQQRRAVTVKHAPIVNPDDTSESWSAQQNIIDSKQYERLLQTNPAFRKAGLVCKIGRAHV